MEENFDTDLEDNETDQSYDEARSRLSFNKKLAAHRSNRLNQTFGHISNDTELNDETLVSLPKKLVQNQERDQIYAYCCQRLDVTNDWQIRAVLSDDHITIINRSFCFNDIRAFATAIEDNLESLTLSSVGLTTRSLNVLCQGLNKCVHLNLLDLSYNKMDKKAFEILNETISHLPSLLSLSLSDCGIQDSYGRCIGDLCRHKKLKEINLSGNEFEEMACIFIGNALTDNSSLTHLNTSWNLIRSFASIALFRGFEVNKTLTDFDISWSNLGYDGSVAIRRVLIVNKVLQRLNINNCNIDWTCAKLISEGLAKNSTLSTLNLAFNPLTTHGVHCIVQALSDTKSILLTLDISGIAVVSETLRLAEKIAVQRRFVMKYDFETSLHDIIGRQRVTKADSVRKIIQHIDDRRWRAVDYFRIMDNKRKLQLQADAAAQNPLKPESDKTKNPQELPTSSLIQPLTLKNLNDEIHRQRMRDRSQKARKEQVEKDLEKRNQKILLTVNQHFPNIDIIGKRERRKAAIEQLAKPRMLSGKKHP